MSFSCHRLMVTGEEEDLWPVWPGRAQGGPRARRASCGRRCARRCGSHLRPPPRRAAPGSAGEALKASAGRSRTGGQHLPAGGRVDVAPLVAAQERPLLVLDAASGRLLSTKPIVPTLNSARGIDMKTGGPIMNPAARYDFTAKGVFQRRHFTRRARLAAHAAPFRDRARLHPDPEPTNSASPSSWRTKTTTT